MEDEILEESEEDLFRRYNEFKQDFAIAGLVCKIPNKKCANQLLKCCKENNIQIVFRTLSRGPLYITRQPPDDMWKGWCPVNQAKDILDKWATQVLRNKSIYINKDGKSVPNGSNPEDYSPENYDEDIVLWTTPKDSLRLEFEDSPKRNLRYIRETESVLNPNKKGKTIPIIPRGTCDFKSNKLSLFLNKRRTK